MSDKRPNAAAIAAIANHYCIQRDPRHTAGVIGDIASECARRLTEGHMMIHGSLECEVFEIAHDCPNLKRSDLVKSCASLIEMIALLIINEAQDGE